MEDVYTLVLATHQLAHYQVAWFTFKSELERLSSLHSLQADTWGKEATSACDTRTGLFLTFSISLNYIQRAESPVHKLVSRVSITIPNQHYLQNEPFTCSSLRFIG